MPHKSKQVRRREREAGVRVKLAKRRAAATKKRQEDHDAFLIQKRYGDKGLTIRRDAILTPSNEEVASGNVVLDEKDQLQQNVEALEALQAEYLKEQQDREALNTKLEAEGHDSIQKKVEALIAEHKKIAEESCQDS